MKSVIFLVSGNGRNLKFIYHAIKILGLPGNIPMVIADRDCGAIYFAKDNQIPHQRIDYPKADPGVLDNILKKAAPSFIISNIHKILATSTLSLKHTFLNLHSSILLIGRDI